MIVFFVKHHSPIVKKAQLVFCELVGFGLFLSYVSVPLWNYISKYVIGIHSVDCCRELCIARVYLLGIGITLVLS
jgi:hypothetical protein